MPNSKGSKVDHASESMTSLAIDSAARDSMMQLTGQNQFTRSLSGGYKMTNGSRVRKLFFKNWISHQRKFMSQRNSQSMNVTHCEDGKSMAMLNEFYKKQCHV